MSQDHITIRVLVSSEAGALADVAAGVFDHVPHPRWTADFFADPRHHLAVAELDGRVIGMASAVHYVHPDKPPEMWVNEVGVAPEHQGRGLGRRLMEALLAHGRALGCSEAWVLADEGNEAARRLYAAVGGREKRQIMVSFDLRTR